MKIKNVELKLSSIFALALYYSVGQFLPRSNTFFNIGGRIRRVLCKRIFLRMGKNVNIERRANFGSGRNIMIGDNSGLGMNCCIPSNTVIGKNVMMGPNCYIFANNHSFDRIDIPMIKQGKTAIMRTIIGDDVWIGRNVTMTPGRHISNGSIIAACCVLTKDFPEYSVIGGNPSVLLKSRIKTE